MLRHYFRLSSIISLALDFILIKLCFLLSYKVYYQTIHCFNDPERLLFCYSFIAFYFISAQRRDLIKAMNFLEVPAIRLKTLYACLTAGLLAASFVFFFKITHFSRIFFALFVCSTTIALIIKNGFCKYLLRKSREWGYSLSNVLLLCPEPKNDDIFQIIKTKQKWGMKVIGEFHYLYASPEEFRTFLLNEAVDQIYVEINNNCEPTKVEKLRQLLEICESMGKTLRFFISCDFINQTEFTVYEKLYEQHTFVQEPLQLKAELLFWKRFLDIIGSLIGTIITLALIPPIWLIMAIFDRGPLFYSQTRVGWNGRTFKILKFRTMIVGAEKMQAELVSQNEMQGAMFKIRHDPRITRLGQILRRFSLDEFPQFFNVLKGEMSLVGTRPPTPNEVRMYQDWHFQRIMLKPGLTGLWQTSGRSNIHDFDTIVQLDLTYIRNWSLWTDAKIILKTIRQLFGSRGAY